MPHPQTAPCVNINDEVVEVVSLAVTEGQFVKCGDVIGAVETDKSLVDVMAEQDGYVLKVTCEPAQKVRVGSVMLWLGDTPDEPVPEQLAPVSATSTAGREPTAKARAMLKALGLDAGSIPVSGDRLTVADVEAFLARATPGSAARAVSPLATRTEPPPPAVPGEFQELSAEAAGMLRTVLWHRDHAAAAYLEIEYDLAPWDAYAAHYATEHKLMLSPLLPLMAFRLAVLARERTAINSTVIGERRYQYRDVNLGFTVQAGATLYLAVVRNTQDMDAARFILTLGEVQRHAMAHKLPPDEATGATLSFSSMSRWNVSRHVPILPPQTSLIVAHAAPKKGGPAVLGASYDHRLLSGFEVLQALQALSLPPV